MLLMALFPTAYAELKQDFSFGYDGMIINIRYYWINDEGGNLFEVLTELPESYGVYTWDGSHEYNLFLQAEYQIREEFFATYAIPDLGDSSVSVFALAALAVLALTGTVIAHRQASHKANHESEGSADLSAPSSLRDG